ncbi:hypothetical protein [Azospirillum sp. sgz302134]
MTTLYGTNHAKTVAVPAQMVDGADWGGRVSLTYDEYTALGTEVAGDVIKMGRVAPGERVIGGTIVFEAMGAGRTLTVGDTGAAARYLAATSCAATGSATLTDVAGFGFRNATGAALDLIVTVGGGALAAGKMIKIALLTARL